jgi:hypothetical protein
VQEETGQDTAREEGMAANPLETRARKRTDAERQRIAEAQAARADALAELNQERQLYRAAEELQITADNQELEECLKNSMELLTHQQVERVANAVQGTTKGPLEALRGLSAQLAALCSPRGKPAGE